MSWLQTHEVAIPYYEVREGKQVFAIQLQERSLQQRQVVLNWSRQILVEDNNESNSIIGNSSGARISAMRSYSQFRKLWRALILATKTPTTALLSRSHYAGPARVEHSSNRLLANSFHALPHSGSKFSSSCRCRNWNCMFHSFYFFLKSYPFPPKFLIKRSTPAVLEIRRQKLELFITTVRGLFDTFPRPFLQGIDALGNCQVLRVLNDFFGFNNKTYANSVPRRTLELPSATKATQESLRVRSDSVASESTTCFSISSQSGVRSDCKRDTTDKDSCSKTEILSADEELLNRAGAGYYLQGRRSNLTNYGYVMPEFDVREFQNFPVFSNDKNGDNNSTSISQRMSAKYSTFSRCANRPLDSSSHWIRCSRGFDVRRHTAFLARNPAIAMRSCSATFDATAPQTLLPGLPKRLSTSEETSIRSFLEEFRDHLLMDPRALGNSATPMGDRNEDRQWELALYVASQIGHVYAVESILHRGTDPNAVMEDGLSSLQVACRGGHQSIVAMLLTNGADTNLTDPNGVSPLLSAVQQGDIEIVEMLVEYGANVNLCNVDSVSAVHVAVACQMLPVLKLLLENDAFVNIKNKFNGKTPLHLAAQFGSLSMCKLLLNHGASIHHKTVRGLDVVDLAKSHGHENIARYCLDFDNNYRCVQLYESTTTAQGASTSEYTHEEVRIVSEDGNAYAIL